jgi:hypothetical protein
MPIAANHVQFFKAQTNNDLPENGGPISTTLVADGVKNNIFPDASKSERLNGSTKYRKLFLGLRNPDNTAAIDVKLFVLRPTQAQDAVLMVETSNNGTQEDIIVTNRRWGAGMLVSAVSVGATSITVTPEQSVYDVFQAGDTIAITTRSETSPSDPIDYYIISAVSADGANKIITLNRGLDNAMPSGAVISSCVFLPTLNSRMSLRYSNGTFDLTKIIFNNSGAIDAIVDLEFRETTGFYDLSISMNGSYVTFENNSVATDFSPINPLTNQPYLTITPAVFSGPYNNFDGFGFNLYPADHPFFLERIIPAGTSYAAGNSVLLAVELESA